MKLSSRAEKWGTGLLGLVSLVLLVNLFIPSGTRVGASRPATPPTAARREGGSQAPAANKGFGDLVRYDPTVHLDTLKEIRERSLPELNRNPFEFPPERPPEREIAGTPTSTGPGAPSAPPVPRVPLKALGFTEKSGGMREAIVTDDDQIFIVHEGETFARRFRVVRISPTMVELEDDTTHQSIRLPISQ